MIILLLSDYARDVLTLLLALEGLVLCLIVIFIVIIFVIILINYIYTNTHIYV